MKNACCIIVILGSLLGGGMQAVAETYRIGTGGLIGWSLYRVAQVKGLWDKQGLSLELVEYTGPHDHLQGYLQQRYVFAPSPASIIVNHLRDGITDSIYLGTLSIADHHKYFILKNDLLNTSLKGETIGIFGSPADAGNLFLLSTYLKTVNTNLADIRFVLMNPDELEANFLKNRLRAVLTVDRGNKFYEQVDGVIASSTRTFYEPHGLVMRKSVFDTIPPDDLKKFLRGALEAIQWIRDPANWEEYKGILKKYYLAERSDLSDEQILDLTKDMKFVDPQTLLAQNQEQLPEYFTLLRAFVAAEELLQGDALDAFTYENAIHNHLFIEVLQEFVE